QCCFLPRGSSDIHYSFPTRRSSDLVKGGEQKAGETKTADRLHEDQIVQRRREPIADRLDGKTQRRCDGHRVVAVPVTIAATLGRSEEHTSELQSRENLVCRLLLEKK